MLLDHNFGNDSGPYSAWKSGVLPSSEVAPKSQVRHLGSSAAQGRSSAGGTGWCGRPVLRSIGANTKIKYSFAKVIKVVWRACTGSGLIVELARCALHA